MVTIELNSGDTLRASDYMKRGSVYHLYDREGLIVYEIPSRNVKYLHISPELREKKQKAHSEAVKKVLAIVNKK